MHTTRNLLRLTFFLMFLQSERRHSCTPSRFPRPQRTSRPPCRRPPSRCTPSPPISLTLRSWRTTSWRARAPLHLSRVLLTTFRVFVQAIARRPFVVDELLERALQIVCASAAAKHINIVASAASAVPPQVIGDPDRIMQVRLKAAVLSNSSLYLHSHQQVLLNLLSNSVKCVRFRSLDRSANLAPVPTSQVHAR